MRNLELERVTNRFYMVSQPACLHTRKFHGIVGTAIGRTIGMKLDHEETQDTLPNHHHHCGWQRAQTCYAKDMLEICRKTCLVQSKPSSIFTTGRHAKAQANTVCDVGSLLQEQLHHLLVAVLSCNVKGGPTSAALLKIGAASSSAGPWKFSR